MKSIYLDNAATTPLDKRVLEAMMPWLKENYGNASSVHSFGREAKVLLEDARDTVAGFIGATPSEVYFTSGATEANNFALKGIAYNRLGYTPDGEELRKYHIISSSIEHSAVIDSLEYLKNRFGFELVYLSSDKFGRVDLEELDEKINDDTFLVTVMHSNNELGIINDVKSISRIARERKVLMHTDTVQSFGKIALNVKEMGCDTATVSAHKIYGPKGIGALYIKRGTNIDKFIHGGKQERDRRGGTENIAAIAGFKKAIEILKQEMQADIDKYKRLRYKLISMLNETFGESVIINSVSTDLQPGKINAEQQDSCLMNILNISFNPEKIKRDPETILIKLDLGGIAVSAGSACTSGMIQPSHVLKAIGYDDKIAKSSLRISFGRFNSESDVDEFVRVLKDVII
jgi:cysteine desulfurase